MRGFLRAVFYPRIRMKDYIPVGSSPNYEQSIATYGCFPSDCTPDAGRMYWRQ